MLSDLIIIQQTITVMSAIGIVGTAGGYEQGMFGLGRFLLQTAAFFALTIYNYKIEQALERLRRIEKRQRKKEREEAKR